MMNKTKMEIESSCFRKQAELSVMFLVIRGV